VAGQLIFVRVRVCLKSRTHVAGQLVFVRVRHVRRACACVILAAIADGGGSVLSFIAMPRSTCQDFLFLGSCANALCLETLKY
jgi:hypothetical protein